MSGMPAKSPTPVVPNLVFVAVCPAGPSKYSKAWPIVARRSPWSKSHCPVTVVADPPDTLIENCHELV